MNQSTIQRIGKMIREAEASSTARQLAIGTAILKALPESKPSPDRHGIMRHTIRGACRELCAAFAKMHVEAAYSTLARNARAAQVLTPEQQQAVVDACVPIRDVALLCAKCHAQDRDRIIAEWTSKGRVKNFSRAHYARPKRDELHGGTPVPDFGKVEIVLPNGDEDSWDRFKDGLKAIQSRVAKDRLQKLMEENWRELGK